MILYHTCFSNCISLPFSPPRPAISMSATSFGAPLPTLLQPLVERKKKTCEEGPLL
ncbi:hypothetical protein B9Z19DRAFT_1087597 [Tuber borchii]|uniref:Uncharacterized protein n=1 Tax=Tuber borchii TaxID=42251 RepID=A0A2T6ZMU2_TUBBO|nr:hypothetical protein B9Z19DRAFT_1087597 [Tuber borchii]